MKTANPSFVGKLEPVAVVRGVTQTFDDWLTRALAEVSFEVYRGEIFGLVGPRASGKSTMLRILGGRLRPTQGKVKVFGRSPRRRAVRARIGYLPGKINPQRRPGYVRWLELLARWVTRTRNGADGNASEAKRRRADLIQALLGNHDLVVLDEPFSDLDPASHVEVNTLIRTLAGSGKTVIFSSASLADAKDICDRIAMLFGGALQAIGHLDELLATTDAIRFTGPVLPPATAERVLKQIREELRRAPEEFTGDAAKNRDTARADSSPGNLKTEPSLTTTAADAILAPLTKGNPPAPPLDHPEAVADSVNHEILEVLTKPATEASPAQPGNTSRASADRTNTNEK
jgi:ABC-2 type transport system ATP-binding protein